MTLRLLLAGAAALLATLTALAPMPATADRPAHAHPATTQSPAQDTAQNTVAGTVQGTPAGAAPQDTPGGAILSVELTDVAARTGPEESLRVRGVLRNTGTAAVADPALTLGLNPRNLSSRTAIASWTGNPQNLQAVATSRSQGDASGQDPAQGGAAADDDEDLRVPELPDELGPGEDIAFEFSVPGGQLGLPSQNGGTNWGPRGINVNAAGTDTTAGTRTLSANAPAFTVWYPDPALEPTRVSLLIPFTAQEATGQDGLVPAEDLVAATASNGGNGADGIGRLTALLETAEAHPEAALAVDPLLLASIRHALGQDSQDEDSTPQAGAAMPAEEEPPAEPSPQLEAWYEQFVELGAERTVIALPWADADPALLAAGLTSAGEDSQDENLQGARALLETADESSATITEVFPEAREDVAWPVLGRVSTHDLDTIAGQNRTVILSDTQQPSYQPYTASALSSLTSSSEAGAGRQLQTLVVDAELYGLLGTIEPEGTGADWTGRGAALSALMAQTAAITAQRPFDQRTLFLPLPREHTAGAAGTAAAVDAMAAAPWLELSDLDGLLDREPVARSPLVEADPASGELARELAAIGAQAAEFNSFLTEPDEADRTIGRVLLECASAAWTRPEEHDACLERARERVDAWTSALHVEEGSPVLLVTGEGTSIPVQVANRGTQPARLTVSLQAQTPQLRAGTSETVEIAPGTTSRVEVPVEGIANGDVTARVVLRSAAGTELGTETAQLVRVRADWEDIGTAIIGAGLVLVLLVGLLRTFRRGRRRLPENQLQAAVERARH
ncbi:DUF6049 family protein [Sediminivirga luteola]|uniref:Uncharacterized protein n=1 Tax=Sediminivirga luteola TaxID=1774748 RepID=A0A8J2TZH1_9MICO|nr:DUF6049 family protein [Sediminivirga luteola]MCI2266614.1 DUF6049 family protein [Sediminivirga luteola]GGA20285.1 hypothetical protein GCM10011333_24310 [Sediminivirga luteola]